MLGIKFGYNGCPNKVFIIKDLGSFRQYFYGRLQHYQLCGLKGLRWVTTTKSLDVLVAQKKRKGYKFLPKIA